MSQIINEIKEKLLLSSVVCEFIDLTPSKNGFKCVCPFHSERTPSFFIDDTKGLFYCFGCHCSGDVIEFYQKIKCLSFEETIFELATIANISIDTLRKENGNLYRYFEINNQATNLYTKILNSDSGKEAREYLKNRKISDELLKQFKVGLALGGNKLVEFDQFEKEDIHSIGLISKDKNGEHFDTFYNRIIFPIFKSSDRICGFTSRIYKSEDKSKSKYINSLDSKIFKKSEILYGLHKAQQEIRQKDFVIIVEGVFDLLRLHDCEHLNSVAILGTSLSNTHIEKLQKLTHNFVLAFDGDKAGISATSRNAYKLLTYGLNVKILILPDDEDIDSFILKNGILEFEKLLQNGIEGLDFFARLLDNASIKEKLSWIKSFLNSLVDDKLKCIYIPYISKSFKIGTFSIDSFLSIKPAKKFKNLIGLWKLHEKNILSFLINYPNKKDDLKKIGVDKILENPEVISFYNKLYSWDGKIVLQDLTEKERKFYFEEIFKTQNVSYEDFWMEIKQLVKKISIILQIKTNLNSFNKLPAQRLKKEVEMLLQIHKDLLDEYYLNFKK